jgi:CheY-like chemotaxis protein
MRMGATHEQPVYDEKLIAAGVVRRISVRLKLQSAALGTTKGETGLLMPGKILTVVEDLIFLSKIQQTAKLLSIPIENVGPATLLQRAKQQLNAGDLGAVILDLNHRSGQAVALLTAMKSDPAMRQVTVIGFLSHVQADLAKEARAAGCDVLLARSAFTEKLPELLQHYAGIQADAARQTG